MLQKKKKNPSKFKVNEKIPAEEREKIKFLPQFTLSTNQSTINATL
jgi:hypothetical protein